MAGGGWSHPRPPAGLLINNLYICCRAVLYWLDRQPIVMETVTTPQGQLVKIVITCPWVRHAKPGLGCSECPGPSICVPRDPATQPPSISLVATTLPPPLSPNCTYIAARGNDGCTSNCHTWKSHANHAQTLVHIVQFVNKTDQESPVAKGCKSTRGMSWSFLFGLL